MESFYSQEELKKIGFKSFGKNVLISRKCSIYTPEKIEIANNVRIDDFSLLSGEIKIGNYVHISAYAALYGKNGIVFEDFSGVSGRVSIYTENDDYSGIALQNPMVPVEYKKLTKGKVILKRFANVGSGSTILPGVILEEGAAVGAGCLIEKNLKEWTININISKLRSFPRSKSMKVLGEKLMDSKSED